MNKILKYGLLGAGAVLAVAVAGVAYVAATFNPNDYKLQIIKAVKDSTQRNLRLDGDIKLSFYPNIGASLSKVSLSELRNDKEFASIESARVSLALMPLLHKQVVVDEVVVKGLKAVLIRHKDGTTNIDDLTGQKEKKQQQGQKSIPVPPVKFDIASVSLSKTDFSYRDEDSGAHYTLKDLNLKTGRVAVGVPSKIELSTSVQANQPKLDIDAKLKTTLTFDLDRQKYQLRGLELLASGDVLDISNLKVQAGGDVSADMAAMEFTAKKFTLNASGIKGADQFDAMLDAPLLSLAKDKYTASKLTLNAGLDGNFGKLTANMTLPGVAGNAQSFKVSALSLDLDVKQPDQEFKVKLSSPLSGNVKAQQFNLSDLRVDVSATGDKLPNKSVNSELKGNVQVDALKQVAQANLSGGLLESKIKADVGVKGFDEPAIKFDVDVDQLDADLYMPKKIHEAAKPSANEPEQPIDLSGLRHLDLDGSLRIGALKVMNVKSTQLRVDIKAHNGLVNISPLSAMLYHGSMNGSMNVNAQGTPRIAVIQNLNSINVAPLMKDAANLDLIEGNGDVGANLTTQGNTVSAMKKALNGHFSLNLANGALKGIDIDKKLLAAQAMLSKGVSAASETSTAAKDEKTAFKEFKATFKVTNGVAHNDDLSLRSELVRVSGTGDINIGNDSVDYFAKAAISKTPDGKGGITLPVHVSGPYTNLKYTLNYGAMVRETVKQKVETKKEEIRNQMEEQLKNKLKGLFK